MKRESLLNSPGLSKLTELKPLDTGPKAEPSPRAAELKAHYEAYVRDVVRGKPPTPEQQAVLDGLADKILAAEG